MVIKKAGIFGKPSLAGFMALFAAFMAVPAHSAAQNWPQWRGPLGTGEAPGANPPVKWSETEGVKWKTKIPGGGSSTPIIWGNQIFIQTAIPTQKEVASLPVAIASAVPTAQVRNEERPRRGQGRPGGRGGFGGQQPTQEQQFVLMSINRETGKIDWQKTARQEVPHEGHHQDHGFSSASPVTDGENVFAYFGSRGLHAFDMKGNIKWSKDFGDMQTRNGFGEGSSPALFGNFIVLNWDHEGNDFIVAVDKNTGRELWRQERNESTSWATPLIVEHEGKAQVVTSGAEKIRSYDLETGKLIWECDGLTANAIPTPVTGDGMVYLTSGFRGNELVAVHLGHTGDLTGTDAIAWTHDKGTPYVPSPLLYNGKVYFFAGNTSMLSVFGAKDGKPVIEGERVEGLRNVYASPVAASGRVYLAGRDGETTVIKEPTTGKIEVLAMNKLDDRFDASPALVGNEIFLRGHENLYCISEEN